eukprot:gnl/MRDRNA2_/MRDRNA2_98423_c0_seq1.p1 gnl/MRDRNA2_/MRDRNA2_98423_c0~~gnl/MRDRNA2_/MRDRNA2_98423_c0_seq1.p1  ORF type:complete len:368 (-),score=68.53 gnl/MRDRNA2_/MRDRNA2_98423_c0_seq1:51-1154(-)
MPYTDHSVRPLPSVHEETTDSCGTGGSRKGIQAQADLKQFLKVVRPEWSIAQSGGGSNLQRVVRKLNAIGIADTQTFVDRVFRGKINDELCAIDEKGFSRETLQTVKQQVPLLKALENADKGPFLRQTGALDPARSLLSKTRLQSQSQSMPAIGNATSSSSPSLSPNSEAAQMVMTFGGFFPNSGQSSTRRKLVLRGPRNDKKRQLVLPEVMGTTQQPRRVSFASDMASLTAGKRIESRDPMWQESDHHTVQQLGEEMLREQHALAEHASLIRQAQKGDDGIRRYITGNIKTRLRQEAERQAAEVLSTEERFRNIRKQIETMSNTRRELSRFRTQLNSEINGTACTGLFGADAFSRGTLKAAVHSED